MVKKSSMGMSFHELHIKKKPKKVREYDIKKRREERKGIYSKVIIDKLLEMDKKQERRNFKNLHKKVKPPQQIETSKERGGRETKKRLKELLG